MDKSSKEELRVHVRWMIRRDMDEVVAIEKLSFAGGPWSEDEFIRCLRERNCIGMVAQLNDHVVGYMIYELHKQRLHVLNFAVDPLCRRHGVGSQLIAKLVCKLTSQRRNRILLEVRETNLDAQMFFRSQGFKAISVLRDFYDDTDEDAYQLEMRHREAVVEVGVVDAAREVH